MRVPHWLRPKEGSRNRESPPDIQLPATAIRASFGVRLKPVGDVAGARPSTPPQTSNNLGFDGVEVVSHRRLSLPVRFDSMIYIDLPERSSSPPSSHFTCVDYSRSDLPACSPSYPNRGRKRMTSFAKVEYLTTTPLLWPSTSRGGDPRPKNKWRRLVSMEPRESRGVVVYGCGPGKCPVSSKYMCAR